MLSIGVAAAADLPTTTLVGALLAQIAIAGAMFAAPVAVRIRTLTIRPAAFALGIGQIALIAFFLRAIDALV